MLNSIYLLCFPTSVMAVFSMDMLILGSFLFFLILIIKVLVHSIRGRDFIARQEVSIFGCKLVICKQLATINYRHLIERLILSSSWICFDLLNECIVMNYSSINGVLFIQMGSWTETNKELRTICVGSRICHRKNTLVSMWEPDSLILKLISID